jgi:hypothetical protein
VKVLVGGTGLIGSAIIAGVARIAFGVPAFAAVAIIYWLMFAKPQITFFH